MSFSRTTEPVSGHGETRHDTHEGGLAASVGAHQRHPRALGDSEVHAVKEASLSEEHGDAGKADEGHGSYLVWLKKITTGDIPGVGHRKVRDAVSVKRSETNPARSGLVEEAHRIPAGDGSADRRTAGEAALPAASPP